MIGFTRDEDIRDVLLRIRRRRLLRATAFVCIIGGVFWAAAIKCISEVWRAW